MRIFIRLISCLALFLIPAQAEDDWREFRGPNGTGHSNSQNLPATWSERENVKWKTPIHGRAWSSPVVLDNQIWMTTANPRGTELFAICVDRTTGRVLRDWKLFDVEAPQYVDPFNSYASPTPVIEPGRVYVTFGSPGTACIDTESGTVLWERRDFICNHFRGAGSSPILYDDLLIMNFDGSDHQFMVALNKRTGQTVWETKRSIDFKDLLPDGKVQADGDLRKAFGTPILAMIEGAPMLITQGAKALYGYEPRTGRELWRVEERTSHSAGTRPLYAFGLIFAPTGWSVGQVLAIRPGRTGEVLDANATTQSNAQLQLAWRNRRGAPKKPSLLLVDDLLYWVSDEGVATCVEAVSGTPVWQESVGGNYSASPLFAEGRIYFFSEEGKATVIAAGREFKKLAENQLEAGFMATPAIAGSAMFLRTKTHLYRVEK